MNFHSHKDLIWLLFGGWHVPQNSGIIHSININLILARAHCYLLIAVNQSEGIIFHILYGLYYEWNDKMERNYKTPDNNKTQASSDK